MRVTKLLLVVGLVAASRGTLIVRRVLVRLSFLHKSRRRPQLLPVWVCKLLLLSCILRKDPITSCSVTMMLFLHVEVKALMTLTTLVYFFFAIRCGPLSTLFPYTTLFR